MRRAEVVEELAQIERELEHYEARLVGILWSMKAKREWMADAHIPPALEERLRELRLRLDRDELLGEEWGAAQ